MSDTTTNSTSIGELVSVGLHAAVDLYDSFVLSKQAQAAQAVQEGAGIKKKRKNKPLKKRKTLKRRLSRRSIVGGYKKKTLCKKICLLKHHLFK